MKLVKLLKWGGYYVNMERQITNPCALSTIIKVDFVSVDRPELITSDFEITERQLERLLKPLGVLVRNKKHGKSEYIIDGMTYAAPVVSVNGRLAKTGVTTCNGESVGYRPENLLMQMISGVQPIEYVTVLLKRTEQDNDEEL